MNCLQSLEYWDRWSESISRRGYTFAFFLIHCPWQALQWTGTLIQKSYQMRRKEIRSFEKLL